MRGVSTAVNRRVQEVGDAGSFSPVLAGPAIQVKMPCLARARSQAVHGVSVGGHTSAPGLPERGRARVPSLCVPSSGQGLDVTPKRTAAENGVTHIGQMQTADKGREGAGLLALPYSGYQVKCCRSTRRSLRAPTPRGKWVAPPPSDYARTYNSRGTMSSVSGRARCESEWRGRHPAGSKRKEPRSALAERGSCRESVGFPTSPPASRGPGWRR